LRKLSGSLSRSGTTAIFINQLREKIGVMFGSPETTPGGRALKFYSSVRLDIRRIGALKVGNDTVGNQTRVKVVKNKVAPPFKTVEFDVMYGEGISREGSLLDIGIENGVIQKSGAWFAYGDERLGQGRENAKQFLKENAEVRGLILDDIYEKLGLNRTAEAPEDAPEGSAPERPLEEAAQRVF
jgi:recombination protein RecA